MKDIAEIEGLEKLTNLETLDLSSNGITELQGLKNLAHLEHLDLRFNHIKEIKGLESLINLQKLYLVENPIREEDRHLLKKEAQEVVKYCQEKASKAN